MGVAFCNVAFCHTHTQLRHSLLSYVESPRDLVAPRAAPSGRPLAAPWPSLMPESRRTGPARLEHAILAIFPLQTAPGASLPQNRDISYHHVPIPRLSTPSSTGPRHPSLAPGPMTFGWVVLGQVKDSHGLRGQCALSVLSCQAEPTSPLPGQRTLSPRDPWGNRRFT